MGEASFFLSLFTVLVGMAMMGITFYEFMCIKSGDLGLSGNLKAILLEWVLYLIFGTILSPPDVAPSGQNGGCKTGLPH